MNTNAAGHPLYRIDFRSGRDLRCMHAFAANAAEARTYFDRVIAPDWLCGVGKVATFVGAVRS